MPKPNENDLEAMLSAEPTEDEEETNENEDKTDEGDESEETLLDEDESGSEDEDESGEDGEEGGKKSKKGKPSAAEERLEEMARTIARMRREMKELAKPAEKTKEEEKPFEIDFDDLVDDESFEKVMGKRDAYIKHLKAVAKKSHDKTVEVILRKLPEIIDGIVSGKVAMQSTIDTFWRANKDLVRHRKFVASIFNDVKERYPDLDDSEIIEKHLAKAARRELGLNAPNKQQPGKKPNVAQPTKGANRGSQKPLKGIAQEILAMEKL